MASSMVLRNFSAASLRADRSFLNAAALDRDELLEEDESALPPSAMSSKESKSFCLDVWVAKDPTILVSCTTALATAG